jgi:iron complex outermembrane receptor protein
MVIYNFQNILYFKEVKQAFIFPSFKKVILMRVLAVKVGILVGILPWGLGAQSVDTLPLNHWDQVNKYNTISEEQFNRGLIIDAMQLVQARLPALMTTRAGNDPNGVFDTEIRGLKTFGNPSPFFLVDGVPVEDLRSIHPSDIASVELEPVGASFWAGMRGGNGILHIKTRQGQPGQLRINYQHLRATEQMTSDPGMMTAIEFRRAGGVLALNAETETNWWEAITRRAASETHHLSLSGGNEQSMIYAALAYDRIEGVALNSGFDRLNGRLNFRQKAWGDRLEITSSINLQNRQSTLTPHFAFLQATQYNPTAPILVEGGQFEEYGAYYQAFLFNNYNPVAILEQNQFDQDYQNLQTFLQAKYTLLRGLQLEVLFNQQAEQLQWRSFSPSNSFYLGRDRNGLAVQHQSQQNNQLGQLGLTYQGTSSQFAWRVAGRAFAQKLEWNSLRLEAADFLTNTFSYNNLGAGLSTANGESDLTYSRIVQSFRGLAGQSQIAYDDKFGLAASVNYEGASHLGENRRWGLFYGASAYAKINEQWQIQASYSLAGNVPDQGLLSQDIYISQAYEGRFPQNGVFRETYEKFREGNPDLQSEQVREFSLGANFSLLDQRLKGGLTFYTNRADHLIVQHQLNQSVNLGQIQYRNTGVLTNGGLEFSIQYHLLRKDQLSWQMSLTGARYFATRIRHYYDDPEAQDFRTGIIDRYPVFWITDGERLGDIRGHSFLNDRPVAPDGNWNFWDRDRDGYFSPNDYVVIGNARPTMQVAWTNRIEKGRWTFEFLLRGIFRYDIIHHTRSLHSAPQTVTVYNGWAQGVRELRDLEAFPDFSERDVESGNFLRLDYLSIDYDLKLNKFPDLQLFVVAQNLFTITSYTGVNPEYRMADRNLRNPMWDTPLNSFAYTGSPLVQGMDRRNTYPLTRTFSLGLQLAIE